MKDGGGGGEGKEGKEGREGREDKGGDKGSEPRTSGMYGPARVFTRPRGPSIDLPSSSSSSPAHSSSSSARRAQQLSVDLSDEDGHGPPTSHGHINASLGGSGGCDGVSSSVDKASGRRADSKHEGGYGHGDWAATDKMSAAGVAARVDRLARSDRHDRDRPPSDRSDRISIDSLDDRNDR